MDHFNLTQQVNHYQKILEQVLQQTQVQLTACPISSFNFPFSDSEKEQLESWILSLNTWYYQCFHQTFFPFYKEKISQEISNIFDLYQDQETLEQNIMLLYKYYAQIYNQISQMLSQIAQFQLFLQQLHIQNKISILKENLQLTNQIQELEKNLQQLDESLSHLTAWNQKTDVRFSFKQFPGHFSILPAIRSYTANDHKNLHFLQELQLHIQLQLDIIREIRENISNNSLCLNLLQNILAESKNELDNKKIPSEIRHWYKQYFRSQQQMYLKNIEDSLTLKNSRHINLTTIETYEAWLNSLLIIIQKLWLCPVTEQNWQLQEVIQYAMSLQPLQQEQKELQTLLNRIQTFLQSIQPSRHPDSFTLLQGAQPILHQIKNLIKNLQHSIILSQSISLFYPLQEIQFNLSLIEFTFDEITENNKIYYSLANQLDHMLKIIKQYQDAFEEFRAILNHHLQSRQVERSLKSVSIKIERWSLQGLTAFPPDAIRQMQEKKLSHLIPQNISSLQGDLFLLQIGSTIDCVIPYNLVLEDNPL